MGVVTWVKSFGKKTLYYPGCLSKGLFSAEEKNYQEIFKRLGISFVKLEKKEFCCGNTLIEAGYRKEAKKLAQKNFERLKKEYITKIITSSSPCYYMLTEIYPKLIPEWDIEIEYITVTILNALIQKKIEWKGETRDEVVYHDPCYLGKTGGIYNEPRKIIEILGGKIIEMRRKKGEALCCGAGGGMMYTYPELSKKMAITRLKDCPSNSRKVISSCGLCTKNFKLVNEDTLDFSSFVLSKLRGMRE